MRIFVFLSLFLVAACGFTPLYDSGNTDAGMRAQLAAIEVAPIPDRLGQIMHNRLLDSLNVSGKQDYRLEITLEQSTETYGTRPDAATTQEQLTVKAWVKFVDLNSSETLFEEPMRARSSYDIVLSDYATVSQREDSARRLVLELAERIHRRIAIEFSRPE